MLGRPTYSPSKVEGFQPELSSSADTEEGCEVEETPEVSLATEEAPSTSVVVPRGSTPPPEGNNKRTKTDLRTSSASPEPAQPQQREVKGTTGGILLIPEQIAKDTFGAEETQRSEPSPDIEVETAPEAGSRHYRGTQYFKAEVTF